MPQAKFEEIGPEEARQMLGMNTANFRNVQKDRVDRYAKEMASGNWKLNGDTIKFNGSMLLDGQHRLLAVVKSGVVIETLVVRGLEEDGKTIDRGKPRTIAQWIHHSGAKYASVLAGAARLCVAHEKGLWSKQFSSRDVIDSEIFDYVDLHNNHLQLGCRLARPLRGIIPETLILALIHIACDDRDPNALEIPVWFCQSLVSGENLDDTQPVLHLRNRLLAQSERSRMDSSMRRALLTMAWNKTVRGEACSAKAMSLRLSGPGKQSAPNMILQVP